MKSPNSCSTQRATVGLRSPENVQRLPQCDEMKTHLCCEQLCVFLLHQNKINNTPGKDANSFKCCINGINEWLTDITSCLHPFLQLHLYTLTIRGKGSLVQSLSLKKSPTKQSHELLTCLNIKPKISHRFIAPLKRKNFDVFKRFFTPYQKDGRFGSHLRPHLCSL